MTQRRTVIAAVAALASITFGLAATGADARSAIKPRITTSIPTVNTIPICYSGPNCQRTKNAALPTTTQPRTVTTPMPTLKPRTKNAALPATTTTKPVAAPANAAKYVVTNGKVVITKCNAGFILTANQCVKPTTTTAKP